ncbi:Uncharacterised protein [uncultured archaeon]|nr:Uncharacterised protein [uncultured archaeon]
MRKEVVLILLLAVAVIALLSLSNRYNKPTDTDARQFFAEDLARSYPNADAREILSSAQVGEGASAYYLLKARVAYNLSTPCPRRLEVEYYYPPQSFVRRSPETLVGNCQVCLGANSTCVLSYMEEAIIASHTAPRTDSVGAFLRNHPEAVPSVQLLPAFNGESNVWQVNWALADGSGISVYLSQHSGQLVDVRSLGS